MHFSDISEETEEMKILKNLWDPGTTHLIMHLNTHKILLSFVKEQRGLLLKGRWERELP